MITLLQEVPVGRYTQTYGFKSYAQYFYGNSRETIPTFDEIRRGNKEYYIICKKGRESDLIDMPELEFVNQSGGFLMFRRRLIGEESNLNHRDSAKGAYINETKKVAQKVPIKAPAKISCKKC
jgi:hypothetical protein